MMKYTNMKPIIPIISFLLVALVGCGTNTIEQLKNTVQSYHDDRLVIGFEAITPLATVPVVEYTVTRNAKGENDVVLTVLRKAAETPKIGVHRAEVTMEDDRRFSVSIPLETPTDYHVNLFLGKKTLGSWGVPRPVEQPLEEPVTEEGEVKEQTEPQS